MKDPDIDRRTLLKGMGAGLAGLAGCAGDGATPTPTETEMQAGTPTATATPEPTEITVTAVWSGGEEEAFQQVLSHVENQANIVTEYHPRTTSSLKTGTLMDYQSGVAPADIVVMPFPARIRRDGRKGHLSPMGNVWNPDNFAVSPSSVTVNGTTYGAPFKMDLKPGFWYRKSFFEEHDLSEPNSYDDFLALLDQIAGIDGVDAPLASGNGTGWPLSDLTEAYFLRQKNGAKLQRNLISGDADFTDQRVKKALSEIQDLLQKDYFSKLRNFSVQYEYFWDNKTPLYFMGSWTPAQDPIKDPSDLGVFRLPGVNGMVASVNWFTVPKYSDNVQAAKRAVELMISAKGQRQWVEQGGFIASNENVPESAYQLDVMAELVQLASDVTLVPDLDDSLGGPFQGAFWAQLKGLWSEPSTSIDSIAQTLEKKQDAALES